ncbi:hypothetical protein Tco_0058839 [Tanacetum coccineum]
MVAGAVTGLKSAIRDMCLGNEFVICCGPIRIEENDRTSDGKANELYRGGYRRFRLSVYVIYKINECLNYKNGVNWMLNAGRSIHGTCTVKPLGGARERTPVVFCKKALTQSATFIHECVKHVLTMPENMILIGTGKVSLDHIQSAHSECSCRMLRRTPTLRWKLQRRNSKNPMNLLQSWFMGAMLHADVQKAMEKEFEKGVYITKVDEFKKDAASNDLNLTKQLDSLKNSFDENSKARLSSFLGCEKCESLQWRACRQARQEVQWRHKKEASCCRLDPKTFGNADADGDGKICIEE